jgi:hypothetical protein
MDCRKSAAHVERQGASEPGYRFFNNVRAGAPSQFRVFSGRQFKSYLPGFTLERFRPSMIQTQARSR